MWGKFSMDEAKSGATGVFREMVKIIEPFKKAIPLFYRLYAGALTFGATTPACEASFSVLTHVLTPYRRSMTHRRKSNIVLIAYEDKETDSLDNDTFLRKFSESNRRLRLF